MLQQNMHLQLRSRTRTAAVLNVFTIVRDLREILPVKHCQTQTNSSLEDTGNGHPTTLTAVCISLMICDGST